MTTEKPRKTTPENKHSRHYLRLPYPVKVRLRSLRTFALIVCAQRCCAGNATVICHASLRLTGPEDKHGVENTGEKIQAGKTPLDHR